MVCSVETTRARKDWTEPVRGSRKGKEIVMLGPVRRVYTTDGTRWAGPVGGIIDQESDMKMRREWAGRVGLNGQESYWGYQHVQTGV